MKPLPLKSDRLFSAEGDQIAVSKWSHQEVENLPIVSSRGRTDPVWFGRDEPFSDSASSLFMHDYYLFRILPRLSAPLEMLGLSPFDGGPSESNPRKVWQDFDDKSRPLQAASSLESIDAVGGTQALSTHLNAHQMDNVS
jgi:glucuronate isomerase